jgi:hypothetical protein
VIIIFLTTWPGKPSNTLWADEFRVELEGVNDGEIWRPPLNIDSRGCLDTDGNDVDRCTTWLQLVCSFV